MIYINQTLAKVMTGYKPGEVMYCPRNVKECMLKGSPHSTPMNDNFRKGLIFESLCLDIPAKDNVDIPTLKNGRDIPVDYKRIQEQAARFKSDITQDHSLLVMEKQLYIEAPWNDEVMLFGTLDIVGKIYDNQSAIVKAIMDLKLTGNIFSQFGDYSWAHPYNMDHTQAYMYNFLYKEKYGEDLPFYYLVFDYSPAMNYKIMKKKIDAIHRAEFNETIRKTVELIKYHDDNGWNENPSFENCKDCPLKLNGTCSSYIQYKPIEEI